MNTYLDRLAHAIRSQVPEDVGVPDDAEDLFTIYALLGQVKGSLVEARDVHDAWVVWMELNGKEHPAMIPFDDLDFETQQKDEPFALAIRSALQDARQGESPDG